VGCSVVRTWSLDVADDATGSIVHEFDADLGDTTTGACSTVRYRCSFRHFRGLRISVSRIMDRYVPVRPRTREIMSVIAFLEL